VDEFQYSGSLITATATMNVDVDICIRIAQASKAFAGRLFLWIEIYFSLSRSGYMIPVFFLYFYDAECWLPPQ